MRSWMVCAALLLLTNIAAAQDEPVPEPAPEPVPGDEPEPADDADRAAAESLLRAGRDLMDLGRYEEAATKLTQSLRAKPSADAAFLLGEAQDKRGMVASAWAAYRQAASMLRHTDDPRQAEAEARAAALEPKVPRLTITADKPLPSMEIVHGETRFDDGVLGVALAVDPGTHHIVVKARGHKPWSGKVQILASERKTIIIPELVKRREKSAPVAASAQALEHGGWWTAGLVTGAIGVASLGAGALLGAIAASHVKAAEDDPALCGLDKICTQDGREMIDRAEREALAATVLLSVGGAAIVAGFVMVLFDEPQQAEVQAWVGPDGGGFGMGGRF